MRKIIINVVDNQNKVKDEHASSVGRRSALLTPSGERVSSDGKSLDKQPPMLHRQSYTSCNLSTIPKRQAGYGLFV